MAFTQQEFEELMAAGLPLAGERPVRVTPDFARLSKILKYNLANPMDPKTRDAIRAWLLALRDHYPTIFAQFFVDPQLLSQIQPPVTGRDIKLRRIAIRHLSRVA